MCFIYEFKPTNNFSKISVNSSTPLDEAVDALKSAGYNLYVYYNNFELSRVDLWRTKEYTDYFLELDRSGGIFRYRWGDAPIRTISLALLGDVFRRYYTTNPSSHLVDCVISMQG